MLSAYTSFTGLRMLSLSCTYKTLCHAVPGGLQTFAACMPYCHLDVVGGTSHAVEVQEASGSDEDDEVPGMEL